MIPDSKMNKLAAGRQVELSVVMPPVFSLTSGVQVVCTSFFLSILGLRRRP
jgi:hypothetical protein